MNLVNKIFLMSLLMILMNCTNNENKTKFDFPPELLATLNDSNQNFLLSYFGTLGEREIDQSLTANCGIATPGVVAGAAGATTPGQPATGGTGTGGANNTRFTVLSQLVFKKTGETLNIKYQYDTNQIQGQIDQQQGFTLTGGVWNANLTGRQGTVQWGQQGIGYVDESVTGAQVLSFFTINIDLKGTFTQNNTGTTTVPFECNTIDFTNCTSTTTTTKCFTTDGKTCLALSSSGTTVTIKGTLRCNSRNVIPN
ncbi:MAG: hypothetical protein SFU98_09790 [Leptospiraceae bacterium]|nr:hypothetical protein [Leptospiraceae bacterium]